jgi:hypothetical protein
LVTIYDVHDEMHALVVQHTYSVLKQNMNIINTKFDPHMNNGYVSLEN